MGIFSRLSNGSNGSHLSAFRITMLTFGDDKEPRVFFSAKLKALVCAKTFFKKSEFEIQYS